RCCLTLQRPVGRGSRLKGDARQCRAFSFAPVDARGRAGRCGGAAVRGLLPSMSPVSSSRLRGSWSLLLYFRATGLAPQRFTVAGAGRNAGVAAGVASPFAGLGAWGDGKAGACRRSGAQAGKLAGDARSLVGGAGAPGRTPDRLQPHIKCFARKALCLARKAICITVGAKCLAREAICLAIRGRVPCAQSNLACGPSKMPCAQSNLACDRSPGALRAEQMALQLERNALRARQIALRTERNALRARQIALRARVDASAGDLAVAVRFPTSGVATPGDHGRHERPVCSTHPGLRMVVRRGCRCSRARARTRRETRPSPMSERSPGAAASTTT